MNAVCEFGQRDADVNQIIREAARRQRATLMAVLNRARNQNELDANVDLDSLADFFESTLAGLRMAAKAGTSRQALRNIATVAEQVYGKADR